METQQPVAKTGFRVRFALLLNVYIAAMVAIYSVAMAYVGYQASLSDSQEADTYARGLAVLSDANFRYTEAEQLILYDFGLYDQIHVATRTNADPAVLDYLQAQYSLAARESMSRANDHFDATYFSQMRAQANENQAQANANFATAQQAGERADNFEFAVLVLAIGLSFTGWASLADEKSALRWVFAVFATIVLFGGGLYAVLWLFA